MKKFIFRPNRKITIKVKRNWPIFQWFIKEFFVKQREEGLGKQCRGKVKELLNSFRPNLD